MVNKKFIVFKIATVLAILIALGVFFFLFYLIFSNKRLAINSNEDILYVAMLFFLLLTGIGFQLKNIWLIANAEKEDLPWPHFFKYHSILLVCNSFGTVGIGIVLYSMILDLYGRESNQQATSLTLLWFCSVWFFANLVSIIGSLHMRTYLHILQIRKERASLENFGKEVD